MPKNEEMKDFEAFRRKIFSEVTKDWTRFCVVKTDSGRLVAERNESNCDEKICEEDKLLTLERKLKESERENVLLREKLGTIKQIEWNRKEAEEKIHAMHKEIDAMNEYIFELKQSLAAQRKINEVLVLGKSDCSDRTSCKKVRWEAD